MSCDLKVPLNSQEVVLSTLGVGNSIIFIPKLVDKIVCKIVVSWMVNEESFLTKTFYFYLFILSFHPNLCLNVLLGRTIFALS